MYIKINLGILRATREGGRNVRVAALAEIKINFNTLGTVFVITRNYFESKGVFKGGKMADNTGSFSAGALISRLYKFVETSSTYLRQLIQPRVQFHRIL